ncbi:MAG: transcriptional repressor LexA [Nitrospirae bacterium]|nr:transcriptional repressor LexA [Candidatus Manganitrophaceae bacterium]
MPTLPLTSRQTEILDLIERAVQEQGYPPTLREIAGGLGLSGTRAVEKHLSELIRKGHLRKGPGRRTLEVISRTLKVKAEAKRPGRLIPILGRVAAGQPILAEENLLGHLTVDPSLVRSKEAFLLKVNGESMKEAGIFEGDYVLVKPQSDADSGEIVVAMTEGEATVKRLIKKKGSLVLKPENAAFKPIVITEKDLTFQILGKVVSLIRPTL